MLLYSTILPIRDTLTKEGFLELVRRWNLESRFDENVIPDLRDRWNGSRNTRYGNDQLWLEMEEYRNENIIAVRYEKTEEDGARWDTDFIMNFNEMKMAIQLDRSYTGDSLMKNTKFSTPHFVTLLIDGGYLEDDNDLAIRYDALLIPEENLDILTDVINGKSKYKLPVVYVSKTDDNRDPVDINSLSRTLKGVAHVLVEEDKRLNYRIQKACDDKNEYFGSIGVYFPNGTHRRFNYRTMNNKSLLPTNVIQSVLGYATAVGIDPSYTWWGVRKLLLTDQLQEAEKECKEAKHETNDYVMSFGGEREENAHRLEKLVKNINSLKKENQSLNKMLNSAGRKPILYLRNEIEYSSDEIKGMLFDAIQKACQKEAGKNRKEHTRRYDVLKDILDHNDYKHI